MSLSVPKVSYNQVSFRNKCVGTSVSKKEIVEIPHNVPTGDCNYAAGLIGWALMIILLFGGLTYGVTELVKDKQKSELNTTPSDALNANTIDYKNV